MYQEDNHSDYQVGNELQNGYGVLSKNEYIDEDLIFDQDFLENIETKYYEQKKKKVDLFFSLPLEIFHCLLMLLPVSKIYELRLVCKRMKEIIDTEEYCIAKFKKYFHQIIYFTQSDRKMSYQKNMDGNIYLSRKKTYISNLQDVITKAEIEFPQFKYRKRIENVTAHDVMKEIESVIPQKDFTCIQQDLEQQCNMMKLALDIFKDMRISSYHNLASLISLFLIFALLNGRSTHYQQVSIPFIMFFLRKCMYSFDLSRTDILEICYFVAYCLCYYDYSLLKDVHQRIQVNINVAINTLLSATYKIENIFTFSNTMKPRSNVYLTDEQYQIIMHDILPGEVVRIMAFAGTGKTSTLYSYALHHCKRKILYIAFNKSVQLYARNLFPHNVECRTWHSIAFQWYRENYKTKKIWGSIPFYAIKNFLRTFNEKLSESDITVIGSTLSEFFISGDYKIAEKHIPKGRNTSGDKNEIIRYANLIFSEMKNPESSRFPITHNFYLKLFQLKKPNLGKYDLIMLDEAQDISKLEMEILKNQSHAGILLVGDHHQAIYAFRGSVDAMKEFDSCARKTFYLTQSFRFGSSIAQIANILLHKFKKEKRFLFGTNEQTMITDDQSLVGKFSHYAFISRKNTTLFSHAFSKLDDPKVRFEFIGGEDGINYQLVEDVYYLYCSEKQKIVDPFIKQCPDFFSLKYHSQCGEEYSVACNLVEQYGSKTISNLQKLRMMQLDHNKNKTIITLSTAHRAKGHEFDAVQLADDYDAICSFINIPNGCSFEIFDEQEVNLFYVAITRSHKLLVVEGNVRRALGNLGCFPSKFNVSTLRTCGYQKDNLKSLNLHCQQKEVRMTCDSCSKVKIIKPQEVYLSAIPKGEKEEKNIICKECVVLNAVETSSSLDIPPLYTIFHKEIVTQTSNQIKKRTKQSSQNSKQRVPLSTSLHSPAPVKRRVINSVRASSSKVVIIEDDDDDDDDENENDSNGDVPTKEDLDFIVQDIIDDEGHSDDEYRDDEENYIDEDNSTEDERDEKDEDERDEDDQILIPA